MDFWCALSIGIPYIKIYFLKTPMATYFIVRSHKGLLFTVFFLILGFSLESD